MICVRGRETGPGIMYVIRDQWSTACRVFIFFRNIIIYTNSLDMGE